MFENKWVYLDAGQCESLFGFKVGYGTGAYVYVTRIARSTRAFCEVLTLNPDGTYACMDFCADDGAVGFGGLFCQHVVEREWAELNIMSAALLDRLDPYRRRLEFPCRGGGLFAEFKGDPGVYDGIAVVYRRDGDGGEVQCAVVETVTGESAYQDDRDGQLLVHAWDYTGGDEDPAATLTVDKDTDMAVFPG